MVFFGHLCFFIEEVSVHLFFPIFIDLDFFSYKILSASLTSAAEQMFGG